MSEPEPTRTELIERIRHLERELEQERIGHRQTLGLWRDLHQHRHRAAYARANAAHWWRRLRQRIGLAR